MDTSKIASAVALAAAPVASLKTAIDGGLPVTADDVKKAWSSVLQKFGCEDGWIPIGPFIQAYNRSGAKLEGLEKCLADLAMDMAQEANAGDYQDISGLGTTFVSSKSACRACPDKVRLMGVTMLARVGDGLRSRRSAIAKELIADKMPVLKHGLFRGQRKTQKELEKRLKDLEDAEAETQRSMPTDSGRVRRDYLEEADEIREILKRAKP